MKVWAWGGRDPVCEADLQLVVALPRRADLHTTEVRLGLESPKQLQPVKASWPGAAEALRRPGVLMWVESEDYFSEPQVWRDEVELEELRARRREAR